MITKIVIKDYKSIEYLELELGRINVFIGENGAGKSNILEAIALAGAANANKLDNEFLFSRGIRVTKPQFMRSAFPDSAHENNQITINVFDESSDIHFKLENDGSDYSKWQNVIDVAGVLYKLIDANNSDTFQALDQIKKLISEKQPSFLALSSFVIYSPENSALRIFEKEGQIQPLGINGEGLLKLLSVLSEKYPEALAEIKQQLEVLSWFDGFDIESKEYEMVIQITDRFLSESTPRFDQKSANEGFLYLLFYHALFISELTPSFFAIDNIDVSLNPKLCTHLITSLTSLAKKHNKQALLTTHNPALLDGLDLGDNEQRLFVVSRDTAGKTKVRRIRKPQQKEGLTQPKLSAMFLNGSLGGLPKGF